jgi:hypothetical protein
MSTSIRQFNSTALTMSVRDLPHLILGARLIACCIGAGNAAEAFSKFTGKKRVVAKTGGESDLAERLFSAANRAATKQSRHDRDGVNG